MPIVRQVVSCPACGASRRFSDLNLDTHGHFLTDPEERKAYPPVIKLNDFGGDKHSVWTVHEMPQDVLVGVVEQLRQALALVERRLSVGASSG
jgi:hypothetical protein